MRILLIAPNSVNIDPWIPELTKRGHQVIVNNLNIQKPDLILGASISVIRNINRASQLFPDVPMINYNWDVYEWVWKNPRGYDWKGYGNLLKKSHEVWCPSDSVVRRNKEWFSIPEEKSIIIKTFARLFDYDGDVKDCRYIYNPLRKIPDRNVGWLLKACRELDIPLVESGHKLNEAQFKKTILECSFMVCEYYEASTGGLTLIEGHKYGKPVLISDSPYMGAQDYFGDRAEYFKHDDYNAFKKKIEDLWENTPVLNRKECEDFVQQYTIERMVDKMQERLKILGGCKNE